MRFLRLNASVSQVCGTVTSHWRRGHTQTLNRPFKIVPANRWPFSGTEAKSHRGGSRAEEYSEEGKEEEGRSNRKNNSSKEIGEANYLVFLWAQTTIVIQEWFPAHLDFGSESGCMQKVVALLFLVQCC